MLVNEVAYTDPQDNNTSFQLTEGDFPAKYTSIMDGTIDLNAVYCLTTVESPDYVPPPPQIRATDNIKSVFPLQSLFKFDTFGTSFTGAYILPDSNTVYGVIGTGIIPGSDLSSPGVLLPPVVDQTSMEVENKEPMFQSPIAPVPHAFVAQATAATPPLSATGLANPNPMQNDSTSSTGYRDVVSQAANNDFNSIITYYMDDDIRTTFVQSAPVVLADATIKAIATDSPGNAAFYKTLQVPYVVSSLSRSTLPEGKQCNAERAESQLKNIPADSPVYKRHSDLLYRHRFLLQFPSIQAYLDDQANTDHSDNMTKAAQTMKNQIAAQSKNMSSSGDADAAAKNLKAAQDDIDSLLTWATSQKLFWAFDLYYWCCHFYLPYLYAQSSDGTMSGTVSRSLKALSGTFGMLEGNQQNPNGKSFQEAFNDLVRVYQMGSIIPQFVDAEGNSSDFDSILKAMLQQFYEDNSNSIDPNIVKEAQQAEQLAANDFLRNNLFSSLMMSLRLNGTLGAWTSIVKQFTTLNEAAGWYQKLVGAADIATTFLRCACVGLLILPMLTQFGGGFGSMNPEQRTAWVTTASALALTFAIKGIQGIIRLNVFWEDLSGFSDCFKAFFGFESVLSNMSTAAEAVSLVFL
jgi:hypothetical protein